MIFIFSFLYASPKPTIGKASTLFPIDINLLAKIHPDTSSP